MEDRPGHAVQPRAESRIHTPLCDTTENGKVVDALVIDLREGGSMDRLLVVGLDEAEYLDLKRQLTIPVVYSELLPRIQIDRGQLLVEKPNTFGAFLPVSKVIFHGI